MRLKFEQIRMFCIMKVPVFRSNELDCSDYGVPRPFIFQQLPHIFLMISCNVKLNLRCKPYIHLQGVCQLTPASDLIVKNTARVCIESKVYFYN